MTIAYIQSICMSLGLTLLIECSLAWFMKIRGEAMKMVVLMNIMTNPTVVTIWFLVRYLTRIPIIPVIAVLEVSVVLVEAWCLRGMVRDSFRVALVLNVVSYGLGLLL